MTTDKKPKAKDREGKDHRGGQTPREGTEPEDPWARLHDLASDFHHAATARRSEDLAKMAHVLRWLSKEPEFREAAHSSLRAYLTSTLGYRVTARREEERTLLVGVKAALITAPRFFDPGYSGRPSSRSETEDRFLVKIVTRTILGLLPLCPQLYGQAKGPPLSAEFTGLPWDDGQEYQETMARVERAIAPEMFDPDSADPEALVRAAMRALGVDPDYVKNMYRD